MTTTAIARSLARELGHDPPFNTAELGSVRNVSARAGSAPPYGLEELPNLTSVGLRGCGEIDLARDIGYRPALLVLDVWTSMLESIERIGELLPNLAQLDISACQVRDLGPIQTLKSLRGFKVAGNPIDEFSFRTVYPDLVRQGLINESLDQAIIREQEWELMQHFVARGLKLSAYKVYEATSINAPGHTVWQKPEGMGVDCTPALAMKVLNENPGIDEKGYLQTLREVVRAERRRK